MKKPDLKTRIEKAKEVQPYNGDIKKETLKLVEAALKDKKIDAKPKLVKYDDVPSYESMPRDKDRGCVSLIFIQFSRIRGGECIAVVGAGKDIGFSDQSVTGKILKGIGAEWDRDELIILPINNLESVSVAKAKNVFGSRNAIEHYIGEYLLEKKMPILNMYSHKNFTEEGWEKLLSLKF